MTQQHGRAFEHTLCNSLEAITPDEVWTTTAGYSGNSEADSCDMVVTVDPQYMARGDVAQFNIEAKKRQGKSGNRVIVADGSSQGDNGIDELFEVVKGTPVWGLPVVALKFDHRKLIVLDARHLLSAMGEMKLPVPEDVRLFDVRATDSGSVSMRKPTLENWESSQAAQSDAAVLAEELGLPYNEDEQ